ncbi:MAG: N-acetyl-gamma-glutamyl-phosphate reductase [Bacillota bacterium]|nr:N-acetyl-gamma-glutamyl-phosphate reductase [Bacillota bacterium]
MKKIFIDGREGTTGLQIEDRLAKRSDIEMISIDESLRKDPAARSKCINESDVTFLCLPDDAARESVSLCNNLDTIIIDASTAHRTSPEFAYGFPELSVKFREKIKNSKRIAVPGCHASGFISLVYPLVKEGLIEPSYPLSSFSVSGYSGAGKKMIVKYQDPERSPSFDSPRQYALGQTHKHLPEMTAVCGLENPPLFSPLICDYYAGMAVSVPIYSRLMKKKMSLTELHNFYKEYYSDTRFLKVVETMGSDVLTDGFLEANTLIGTNNMQLFICGNDERILLCSRFDNLGKGASGAAVQCMNIALGLAEDTGL